MHTLGPAFSVTEKRFKVTASMHNTQDKRVSVFHAVNDNIVPYGHTAASGAKIFLAGTSDIGELRKP